LCFGGRLANARARKNASVTLTEPEGFANGYSDTHEPGNLAARREDGFGAADRHRDDRRTRAQCNVREAFLE
jgi:hypothetical protein